MTDARRYLPLSPQQFHILLTLADRDRHGYGIILDVAERTHGELRMGTGTLYTAVARLEALALIADAGRKDARRQFYRVTPLGRRVLSAETARLESLVRLAHARGVRGKRQAQS